MSIGEDETNELVMHGAGLPGRLQLFDVRDGVYHLRLRDVSGRLRMGDEVKSLDSLTGDAVALDHESRGRVQLGDAVVLFEFVSARPSAVMPLPAAMRNGHWRNIDWLFTAFVVFTYVTFFAGALYVENSDREIEAEMLRVPDIYARLVFSEPSPPPEPLRTPERVVEADPEPERSDSEPAPSRARAQTDRTRASTDSDAPAPSDSRIAEQASQAAQQMIIGRLSNEVSALADVLRDDQPMSSINEVMRTVSGVDIATRGSDRLRERAGGGDGSGTGRDLGIIAASPPSMAVQTGPPAERAVRGTIDVRPGEDTGGVGIFNPNLVRRQIRRRLQAITRCYERVITQNGGNLAGKVTVDFTISESGTVSQVSAVENHTGSEAVARCVTSVVRRFRFRPGPEGGSVSFRYPFVFASDGN
ncbi:MAG: AgmX/PglI C-terminal domain-containing protein [Myxococcota bacterium]